MNPHVREQALLVAGEKKKERETDTHLKNREIRVSALLEGVHLQCRSSQKPYAIALRGKWGESPFSLTQEEMEPRRKAKIVMTPRWAQSSLAPKPQPVCPLLRV